MADDSKDKPGDKKPDDEEEDKQPDSQDTSEKSDKLSLLIAEAEKAISERNRMEESMKRLAEALTAKQKDTAQEAVKSSPDVEALKKEIESLKAAIPLRKEIDDLKSKLKQPANAPRGQSPTVGVQGPAIASGRISKRLSVKESTELLLEHAKKGVPLTRDDWAKIGFDRT